MKFQILSNDVFQRFSIISGVTQVNKKIFPENGFSLASNGKSSSDQFMRNLNYFASKIGFTVNQIKSVNQVHGDKIEEVNTDSFVVDADAMITREKNLLLMIKIADCAGILIYDPVKEIIAAVHSGWKGTSLNIVPKTINRMINEFGCSPINLLVYISPCASGKNYEVQQDVAILFPRSTIQISPSKYLFSNRREIKYQLDSMSIPRENIEVSDICNVENINFHSYRRDRDLSGRMGVFIAMR